jgi:hypothetical protein
MILAMHMMGDGETMPKAATNFPRDAICVVNLSVPAPIGAARSWPATSNLFFT